MPLYWHLDSPLEPVEKLEREEYPEYSEDAYREAIVNAIVHRDYFNGDEVAVEKLKSSIIVNNKGGLLFDEKDFGRKSEQRNRLIADLLSRTIYVEKAGTGIERIKNACLENGNKVEFTFREDDFFVTIKSGIISGGVNGGVNLLFDYIKNNPGKRVVYFEKELNLAKRTIERQLNKLKKDGKIEFEGSLKTGGYFVKKNVKK